MSEQKSERCPACGEAKCFDHALRTMTNNPTPQPVAEGGAPERDPRGDGCLCQRCRMRFKVDVNLPDGLWKEVAGDKNLLCGPCILLGLEARGVYDSFRLVRATSPDSITEKARRAVDALEVAGYLPHDCFGSCKSTMADIIAAEFGGEGRSK